MELVLGEACDTIIPALHNFIAQEKPFKLDMQALVTLYKLTDPTYIIQVLFKKPNGEHTELCQTYLDISEKLERDRIHIKSWVEKYNEMASNWILKSVDQITFDCSEVNFVRGGAGKVCLPIEIANSRCVINFEVLETQD